MDLGLKGKTVVITGGNGGIGQGLVLEFAREGCNVINASRDANYGQHLTQKAEQLGLSGKVLSVATDITQRSSVDAMIEEAHRHFGPIDVLVNNAGGTARAVPFTELDETSRQFDIDLNINGVVNCCQAVARDMLGRGGSIINISSNASLEGASSAGNNAAHYGAVKGFMNSLSKILAWDWGKQGVRVNNICPGWIVPRTSEEVGGGSFWGRSLAGIGTPEDMTRAAESGAMPGITSLPIPRLGRPEDVAYLTLFLASDRSSYITGQLISVSGGAYMP